MAASEITTLQEWQECRSTIARFDGYLADTRKYGFTLVTVLLTANALVSSGNTAVDRPAASIVVMALLFALFMLDNYYWALLRGAVDRAKTLEGSVGDPKKLPLSRLISLKIASSHATDLILGVYGLFVVVAAGIGLTAGITPGWVIVLIVGGLVELVGMFAAFLIVQRDAPPARWFLNTVWRRNATPA